MTLWVSRIWPDVRLIDIVTLPSIFTGVLSCGFFCLVNPWMDRRFLPGKLRMSKGLILWNYIAAVVFSAVGFKALWDYSQYMGFVALGIFTMACFGVAHAVRNVRKGPILIDSRDDCE